MALNNAILSYFIRGGFLKTLNNLGWMLLGVAVGSGTLYCVNEYKCNGKIKETVDNVKKEAGKKIENMMGK